MTTSDERQQVLRMIADGKITPEEGARLLAALSGGEPPALAESAASTAASTEPTDDVPHPEQTGTQQQAYTPEQEVIPPPPPIEAQLPDTRHWWQAPFWIGAALLVAGAFTLAGALSSSAVCLALLCGLPLLLIGILAIIVAWFARNGPWVHIRVKNDRPGERNINLSVPLDLGVVAVRVAEPFVPQMRNTGVDDVILSMKNNVQKDQPLIIDVHDDEDGEHVQVIVG